MRTLELIAWIDGGSHGNPGPAAIGVVITDPSGGKTNIARHIGKQDSNVAEYVTLMEALQYALMMKARALHVYSDSQVMVRQMTVEERSHRPRPYALHCV